MLRPRVGGFGAIKVLSRRLLVDVHGISTNVLVVRIPGSIAAVIVVSVVVVVVVSVAVMISAVVVASVPRSISVVASAVIHDSCAMPATIPAAVSPTATPSTHHRADRDAGTESDDARRYNVAGGVGRSHIAGNHVGSSINNRRVVLRNVDDLWICGLNHDCLR